MIKNANQLFKDLNINKTLALEANDFMLNEINKQFEAINQQLGTKKKIIGPPNVTKGLKDDDKKPEEKKGPVDVMVGLNDDDDD